MSKSKQKKQVKGKIGKSLEERANQKMINKTTFRTIAEDKWERKRYLHECKSDTIKDVIEIRIHIRQVNYNIKEIILTPNVRYVKNQKAPQGMCQDVKKLPSLHLVKKTARENGEG